MQGAYFLFLGPMGLIGPMGPISCDGSYRFYGIDHDGSNRFYGIDSDNGPKFVGTASFELDPAMSSERCCWQSSPSPLRPDVLNHGPLVPQSPRPKNGEPGNRLPAPWLSIRRPPQLRPHGACGAARPTPRRSRAATRSTAQAQAG